MRHATVTRVLDAPREEVFDYMADIENLPLLATEFARELKRTPDGYRVVNGLGEFHFEIRADRTTRRHRHVRGARPRPARRVPDTRGRPARWPHRLQLHDVPDARHARFAV
jgi:hypothetical protein